jgi:hypothetical protein
MRKEKYYSAEMEIIRFDSDDIITSSPTSEEGEASDPEENEDGGEL